MRAITHLPARAARRAACWWAPSPPAGAQPLLLRAAPPAHVCSQDCQLTVRKLNDRQYVASMPNVRAAIPGVPDRRAGKGRRAPLRPRALPPRDFPLPSAPFQS